MQEEKSHPTTVDEYIAQYPEDVQQILVRLRAVIIESAPEAVEKISYHMPTYFQNGMLVSFGVWKSHIGLYPKTSGMQSSIEGLSAYKGTKSSLHFPLDKAIPYELVGKIVKYRVVENREGAAG